MHPQRMQKYLFKAYATAVEGSIRKPYYQDVGRHLAIATYAGSSGRTEATNRDFALGQEVSYKFARTSIEAVVNGTLMQTTLEARVEGLQVVGKRLTVDEVVCRLHSVYDSRSYPGRCLPRIIPAGSTIQGLRIDGVLQKLDLPAAFGTPQQQQDAFLRGEADNDTALQPGPIPEPIYVKGLGTIFYAEWTWVHPQERHQQRLTMLRLALGSDTGVAVDISTGGSDGTGWPPTVS
jgi:hypothetical protein